jgi:lipase chaperone LimK
VTEVSSEEMASIRRNVRDFFDWFLCNEQKVAVKKLSNGNVDISIRREDQEEK